MSALAHVLSLLIGSSAYAGSVTLDVSATGNARYALEVSFPSPSGSRVIVDRFVNPLLGGIQPESLTHKTITVYRDGRVTLETSAASGKANMGGSSVEAGSPAGIATLLHPSFAPVDAGFPPYLAGTLTPAWGDYDNDGDVDLPLYRNDGNGTFSEIPGFRTLLDNGNYHGSAWGDYDGDGNDDLVIAAYPIAPTRTLLLHNRGDGSFENVAPEQGMDVSGHGETAVWGDFDGDGWLDLFVPYYTHIAPFRSFLYHNNGDGTFTDVAAAAGVDLVGVPQELRPEGAHAADWDEDGDLDLYCASHLFMNDGTGHFVDVRAQVGLPQRFDEGSMFVDYDNDGDLDLYVRNADSGRIHRNDGGTFKDVTAEAGIPAVPFLWGDSWADVDNDGDLDLLYCVGNAPARLLLNRGDGTFEPDSGFAALDLYIGQSAWGDFDDDGDLDVAVNSQPISLYANQLQARPLFEHSYLRVRVLDAQGRRTEHGATVRLRPLSAAPGGVQTRVVGAGSTYLAHNEYITHFGLAGSGTVTKSPDRASYDLGEVVQLTATPAAGFHFVGWSGGASGTANPLDVVMDENRSITATFAINTYALDVSAAGNGAVTRVPDQAIYEQGTTVGLTATPAPGHHFVGWSGDTIGTANPLTVLTDRDRSITALFAVNTYTLEVQTSGSGTVSKSPEQPTYDHGSSVQLTAQPTPGHHFTAWSGDASGTANPLDVAMDGNRSIVASFEPNGPFHWSGAGDGTSWASGLNWAGGSPPTFADQVVLDHTLVSGSYSVRLPSGPVTMTLVRLTIAPDSGKTITLVLPEDNTAVPGLMVGDATAGTDDIVLHSGAELRNASGATSGNGVEVVGAEGRMRIANGARYVHNTRRSTAVTARVLSTAPGTEMGEFVYDVPGTPVNFAASGVTYGSLILRGNSYSSLGSAPLTVRGNFTIGLGASYQSKMTGDIVLGGDLTNDGTLTLPANQTVVFNGASVQTVSGMGGVALLGPSRIEEHVVVAVGGTTFSNFSVMTIHGALRIESEGSPGGSGSYSYAATGTLIFNHGSGSLGVTNQAYWPQENGPQNVTVQGGGGISMNVSRTVSGLFQTAAAVEHANRLTVSGVLQLNPGGALVGTPFYSGNATLIYNTGGAVAGEWGMGNVVGTGVPKHVTVRAGAGEVALPSGRRTVVGDLVVESGTLALAGTSGRLELEGNLTVMGAVAANGGVVEFGGAALQTVAGVGVSLGYVRLVKTGGSVRLESDLRCGAPGGGNGLEYNGTADVLELNGRALRLMSGAVGGLNPAGALKGSAESDLELSGSGPVGRVRFVEGSERLRSLTMDRAGESVTLDGRLTVEGVLGLANGRVVADTLVLGSGGTVARVDGHVEGWLRKRVDVGASGALFEVGSGGQYAPVELAFEAVSEPGELTVGTAVGEHTSMGSSGLDTSRVVHRHWTVGNDGVVVDGYSIGLSFGAGEVSEEANPENFTVRRYEADTWTGGGSGARTGTSTEGTGFTGFGDFAVGELPDSTAPDVQLLFPDGGETLMVGATADLRWTVSDVAGVAAVDIHLSRHGALGPYEPIAMGEANDGEYRWTVTGPGTVQALLMITARDRAGNTGTDVGDSTFAIAEPLLSASDDAVSEFALLAVSPNPTRGATTIDYAVPRSAPVRVALLDLQGREVAVVADGLHGPGRYRATWDGMTRSGRAAPGAYFVRYRAAGKHWVRRIVVTS